MKADEIEEMLADCEDNESQLTDWELDFIQSIRERVGRNQGLSPRQEAILERIWYKVT